MADTSIKNAQDQPRSTGNQPSTSSQTYGNEPGSHASGQTAGDQARYGGSATRQAREQRSDPSRSFDPQAIKERGAEMVDQARETFNDAYERASQSMTETWDQAMRYSRQNPGTATLIAFGAGIGFGLLLANGLSSRGRTRRLVPPVMNALSEIATELFR